MDDVLAYAGTRAVVTGAASGMGAAVAGLLHDLGATVIGLDRAEINGPVDEAVSVDLLDPASIAAAADAIDGPIDALFACAGLPGPPFAELDVVLVNFVGGRELIEALLPKMRRGAGIVYTASVAGLGWQPGFADLSGLLETQGFAAAQSWLEDHPDLWQASGYVASKQAINAWVAWVSADLMTDHGVRINCTNPGPTETAMMPFFHDSAGKGMVDASVGAIGRYSSAEEQAWPMVMLNSPRSSYVSGEGLFVDGGFFGALQTGKADLSALMPPEE